MKLFVSGFILLILVASTLGNVLPMPLQEDANSLQEDANSFPAEDARLLQENAQGRRPYNDNIIGRLFLRRHNTGSCQSQYM